jgi:hypothetical protein
MNNIMEADLKASKGKDLYREAMDGIGCKVALQAVRKVIRDNKSSEKAKLEQICIIVHSYEKDMGKEG